jgi:hypothetical protein
MFHCFKKKKTFPPNTKIICVIVGLFFVELQSFCVQTIAQKTECVVLTLASAIMDTPAVIARQVFIF